MNDDETSSPFAGGILINKVPLGLTHLSVEAFRGIRSSLDLSLSDGNRPTSLLMFGENGAGKSSIIDAIEFGLRAKVTRDIRTAARFLRNLAADKLGEVQVTLSDGSSIERRLIEETRPGRDPEGEPRISIVPSDRAPHPDFEFAPLILRRADILRFIETPDAERQRVFLGYLEDAKDLVLDPGDVDLLEELERERLERKRARRSAASVIAEHIDVDQTELKLGTPEFDRLVKERVFKGLSRRELWRRRGIRTSIPKGVDQAVRAVREETREIKKVEREITRLKRKGQARGFPKLAEVLSRAGETLTDAFRRLSPSEYVEKIMMTCGDVSVMSLTLTAELRNGRVVNPLRVFSEANMDLLALLVFLSLAKESAEQGQAKVLVLDDVTQSVDSTIRTSVIDYILSDFPDWQLIVTSHDRLWHETLIALFRRHGKSFTETRIVRWEFESGPILRTGTGSGIEALQSAIDTDDVGSICAAAGRLLEEMCDELSWRIPISVQRRSRDKYTLGDLWPGVRKALRKSNAGGQIEEVDKWMHLRNLIGAHYNQWAVGTSLHEARRFGIAVIDLHGATKCATCGQWRSGEKLTCSCETR